MKNLNRNIFIIIFIGVTLMGIHPDVCAMGTKRGGGELEQKIIKRPKAGNPLVYPQAGDTPVLYQCPKCPYIGATERGLSAHMGHKHSKHIEKPIHKPLEQQKQLCCLHEGCPKTFACQQNVTEHMANIHKKMKCPKKLCRLFFDNQQECDAHFQTHQSKTNAARQQSALRIKYIKCPKERCQKYFADQQECDAHFQTHAAPLPAQPQQPALSHKAKSSLSSCEKCKRTFNSERQLCDHQSNAYGCKGIRKMPVAPALPNVQPAAPALSDKNMIQNMMLINAAQMSLYLQQQAAFAGSLALMAQHVAATPQEQREARAVAQQPIIHPAPARPTPARANVAIPGLQQFNDSFGQEPLHDDMLFPGLLGAVEEASQARALAPSSQTALLREEDFDINTYFN